MNKKGYKRIVRKCRFCNESDITVLDVHRIIEGCNGGEYTADNVVCLCSNCHRKVHHSKSIVIKGWVMSTAGMLLNCIIDGEETFV